MLGATQIFRLIATAIFMWTAATMFIHWLPECFIHPSSGALGFAIMLPGAWLSVALVRRAGRLVTEQLLSGVGVVGAVAMMLDGVVLRWFPRVYGSDGEAVRCGAAWLLWGYGVSLGVALLLAARSATRAKAM